MQSLYHEIIMDRYHFPRHKGTLECGSKSSQANPACGDQITFFMHTENGAVTQVAFTGVGCILSLAAADLLAEQLHGKSVHEVQALSADTMRQLVGIDVGPLRIKCILLPLQAAQQAAAQRVLADHA